MVSKKLYGDKKTKVAEEEEEDDDALSECKAVDNDIKSHIQKLFDNHFNYELFG